MVLNLNTYACIKHFFIHVQQSLFHLIYPTHCLHCQELVAPSQRVLCEACAPLLEILFPDDRCVKCFNESNGEMLLCEECIHTPSPFARMGSVFDYQGPAADLVKQLKYANRPYLAKGMGAFLYLQFIQLRWPKPDLIVPIPISLTHWFERGYNQTFILAQELGHYLQVPVMNSVQRKGGDFSQAALSYEQRQLLTAERFDVPNALATRGKTILLIDDVLTTGTTLRCCAEALIEKECGPLYALTFCRTQPFKNS